LLVLGALVQAQLGKANRHAVVAVGFASRSFPFTGIRLWSQWNLRRGVGVAKNRHGARRRASSTMKRSQLIVVACLVFTLSMFAQNDTPAFRVEATSALVWDKDLPESATSSIVWDPLTGNEIHKLRSAGVEVSSRIGYERVSSGEVGKLLHYTTTIANHTDSDVSVNYGGASVDGHVATPLWVALTNKGSKKRDRKNVWELSKMHCFKTGFASSKNFFSAHDLSETFTVRPQTAMTISSVTKDPRDYSVRCSLDGCQVTGTVRYYITVNGKDYVFIWPGKSVVYCGE
jgi:hypothetical protein